MRRIGWLSAVLSIAYAVAVVGWQVLRLVTGDRWWWLALANVLSLYLFLPLVGLVPLALLSRRKVAILATAIPLLVFLVLYDRLFLPKLGSAKSAEATRLRVMTLNVYYTNDDGAAVEQLVRAELPDLICLQELNPRLATDLVTRLADEYPYYALLPEENATGLGMFSRYPFRDEGEIPDPVWARGAQRVLVEFEGESVLVLNVHALPPSWPSPSSYGQALLRDWPTDFEHDFPEREREVRLWLDHGARHDGPVIVAGDLNFTDQSKAYRMMGLSLHDSFRRAGWGLGHTYIFDLEGGEKASIFWRRLFRIDYVWHSDHWRVSGAHVGDWDGQSNHLPVVADLALRGK